MLAPVLLCLAVLAGLELRTSRLQSMYFSARADGATFELRPGPSGRIHFPQAGPYDLRLGYAQLPATLRRAGEGGFDIVAQAVVSHGFEDMARRGYFPPYREKAQAGLTLLDRAGDTLFAILTPEQAFADFESIPEVLWRTLLFVESREFLDPRHPNRNPAVEWDRLARSVFDLTLRKFGSRRNVPGASTLATQIEKYRHSPGGLTDSPRAKLQQMTSASLRAYMDGPETLSAQRRIIVDYLNSVPLAAAPGFGEVIGMPDGLHAWFGTDFGRAVQLLRGDPRDQEEAAARGEVFRQALGLILAQRRPSYYLIQTDGREELGRLSDAYLGLLEREAVIPPELARAARESEVEFLARAPYRPTPAAPERKLATALRASLRSLLDVPQIYDLDRYDLTALTSIDGGLQDWATAWFDSLADSSFVRSRGLDVTRILARGDPSRVLYSLLLSERTPQGNAVRAQADNFPGPLNLNESSRIELGSTAKLRTLVTYLETMEDLHRTLASLSADSLAGHPVSAQDPLARWAVETLQRSPGLTLPSFLLEAMERRYSANPRARFVTGGGTQTFTNFDTTYDDQVLTVREGFQQSVNLVWVRVMRDLVSHLIYRSPESVGWQVEDRSSPLRREYMARFADEEGTRFVDRFLAKHRGKPRQEILAGVASGGRTGPLSLAWAFRAILPDATPAELGAFLHGHAPDSDLSEETVVALFERTDPAAHSLSDLGYLSSVHPLELWVAHYLDTHPAATRGEVLAASAEARQEVYRWLFRTRNLAAQDTRIRFMLELDAFSEIHASWQRLGYPFGSLVPSYGTAIGSSGDRPSALAELMGILLCDGVRMPTIRVEELHFAEGTPFQTVLGRRPVEGNRVLSSEVAAVARRMLEEVVEAGTARRVRNAVMDPAGRPLLVGGKTGTGDNRFRVFAPGGRLLESRVVNRTATFAFFVGDRYFGVITAYVPGPEAGDFDFTSALPLEVFREVASFLGGG